MKRLFTIMAVVILTASVFAQSPQKMSYQAVIRNSSDQLVTNHTVGMRISILQGSSSGTVVYTETQTPITNANGLVSIEIGGVAGFDAINWANYTFYIKTETDPTGGTSYTITGTSQILSVPYALHAKTVASYPETDPVFIAHPSHGIASTNITNWNSAYGWGNHSGLYRPIGYVPAWGEITSNPFSFVSPTNNQLLKFNSTTSKFENWTPNFLTSFTETDPIFGVWNKSTGISIIASQVSDFQTSVTNNASMLLNTAKVTNATHTGDATGSGALTLANVNSNVGTFNNITINAKGLSTAGSNVSYLTSETDPVWTTASVNYYTQTNMQTSGASQLHFNNLTNTPTTIAGYGITDAVITTGNQTIAGNKTFSGTTTVITPVNANDAANKAYVDNMLSIIQNIQSGIRDIDGNIYKVVLIANQLWMAENLKTTKYNDGTAILNTTDNTVWTLLTAGDYCDYNNTPSNSTTYGRLYNWYAVDNNAATKVASNGGKNVCPTGWHIPTDAEWTTLTDYLINNGYGYQGSGNDIGKSMANTSGWTTDPTAGNVGNDQASNNSSGFTALPSGNRTGNGLYYSIGGFGYWWSSTESSATDAYLRSIGYSFSDFIRFYFGKQSGFSVRCLRD